MGQDWIVKVVDYYTNMMRKESAGAVDSAERSRTARKLYRTIQQVRNGDPDGADDLCGDAIRDIREISEGDRDGGGSRRTAEIATTTLLTASVLRRMDDVGGARAAFHEFFRASAGEGGPAAECACTGRVLAAYASFEMRHGSALEAARMARRFDARRNLSRLFERGRVEDVVGRGVSPPSRPADGADGPRSSAAESDPPGEEEGSDEVCGPQRIDAGVDVVGREVSPPLHTVDGADEPRYSAAESDPPSEEEGSDDACGPQRIDAGVVAPSAVENTRPWGEFE